MSVSAGVNELIPSLQLPGQAGPGLQQRQANLLPGPCEPAVHAAPLEAQRVSQEQLMQLPQSLPQIHPAQPLQQQAQQPAPVESAEASQRSQLQLQPGQPLVVAKSQQQEDTNEGEGAKVEGVKV